jgi:hypothetical protein
MSFPPAEPRRLPLARPLLRCALDMLKPRSKSLERTPPYDRAVFHDDHSKSQMAKPSSSPKCPKWPLNRSKKSSRLTTKNVASCY